MGFVRTFSLDVRFLKKEWPQIEIVKKFTLDGGVKISELAKRYYRRSFDYDFKYSKKARISTRIYYRPAKALTEDITD